MVLIIQYVFSDQMEMNVKFLICNVRSFNEFYINCCDFCVILLKGGLVLLFQIYLLLLVILWNYDFL